MNIRRTATDTLLSTPTLSREAMTSASEHPATLIVTQDHASNLFVGRDAWQAKQHGKLLSGLTDLGKYAAETGLSRLFPEHTGKIQVGFLVVGAAAAVYKVLSDGRVTGGEVIDLGKSGTTLASGVEREWLIPDFSGPDDGSRPLPEGSAPLATARLAFGALAKIDGAWQGAVSDEFKVTLPDGTESRYVPDHVIDGGHSLSSVVETAFRPAWGTAPWAGPLAKVLGAAADLLADTGSSQPGAEAARLFGTAPVPLGGGVT